MDVFIGIDPSLNSTGICMLFYDEDNIRKEKFFIVKPDKKLSKKEQIAQEKYLFFDYIQYEKTELKDITDNHIHEMMKTINFMNAVDKIIELINKNTNDNYSVFIVQEGISYGSTLRTKSVFDLAGMNYMIRQRLVKFMNNRFLNSNYLIVPPTEIKKFATGSGNANKEILINNFKLTFPDFDLPKIDDICDAYFMASYAKYLKDKNE